MSCPLFVGHPKVESVLPDRLLLHAVVEQVEGLATGSADTPTSYWNRSGRTRPSHRRPHRNDAGSHAGRKPPTHEPDRLRNPENWGISLRNRQRLVPASRHRVTSPVVTSSQKMESQGKQSGWAAALTRSNPTGAIHGIIPPFGQTLPRARRRKGRGTQAARCAVPSVAGRHPVSSARGRIRPSSEYPKLPESSRDPSLTEDSGCGKIS